MESDRRTQRLVEETTPDTNWSGFGRGSHIDEFGRQNKRLYDASFRRSSSRHHPPSMQFIANINYVTIAVLGGYRVASGLSRSERHGFIQYSRQFTMRSPRSPAR